MARGIWGLVVAASASIAAASDLAAPPPAAVAAADASLAGEFADRIGQLEAEVADLRSRAVASYRAAGFSPQLWELYSSGWYGSAEATILEPFMSGAPSVLAFAPTDGSLIDQRFFAGVRYQVGWANEAGLGIRGRYWSYFQNFTYADPYAPDQLGIDVQAVDLEATTAHRLGRWDTLLAAGVRYGKLGYINDVASIFGVGTATFEGVGPTVAVEGRRRLGGSAFSLYGNVRGSALFGTIANKSLFTSMPASTITGEVMGVAENQLGIAWERVTEGGLVVEVRACWETQYWMNSTLSDDTYGIGTNLGLIGPTIGLLIGY